MKSISSFLFYTILTICVMSFIPLFQSCEKDCTDRVVCPENIEEFIILRFDMDSANGGFTRQALDTLQITYPGTCHINNYEDLKRAHIYDWKNAIFCAMHEYYCCNQCATGFRILNQRTGTIHNIDQIEYRRSMDNDYCCGDYYYVESFYYNGVKYAGGTDVMIYNN